MTKDTDDIAYAKTYYNADKQNLVSTFLLTKDADDCIAYLKIFLQRKRHTAQSGIIESETLRTDNTENWIAYPKTLLYRKRHTAQSGTTESETLRTDNTEDWIAFPSRSMAVS